MAKEENVEQNLEAALMAMLNSQQCRICFELLDYPVSIKCGHRFCKKCIDDWMGRKMEAKCPLCKQRITKRSMPKKHNEFFQNVSKKLKELVKAIKEDSGIVVEFGEECRKPSTPGKNELGSFSEYKEKRLAKMKEDELASKLRKAEKNIVTKKRMPRTKPPSQPDDVSNDSQSKVENWLQNQISESDKVIEDVEDEFQHLPEIPEPSKDIADEKAKTILSPFSKQQKEYDLFQTLRNESDKGTPNPQISQSMQSWKRMKNVAKEMKKNTLKPLAVRVEKSNEAEEEKSRKLFIKSVEVVPDLTPLLEGSIARKFLEDEKSKNDSGYTSGSTRHKSLSLNKQLSTDPDQSPEVTKAPVKNRLSLKLGSKSAIPDKSNEEILEDKNSPEESKDEKYFATFKFQQNFKPITGDGSLLATFLDKTAKSRTVSTQTKNNFGHNKLLVAFKQLSKVTKGYKKARFYKESKKQLARKIELGSSVMGKKIKILSNVKLLSPDEDSQLKFLTDSASLFHSRNRIEQAVKKIENSPNRSSKRQLVFEEKSNKRSKLMEMEEKINTSQVERRTRNLPDLKDQWVNPRRNQRNTNQSGGPGKNLRSFSKSPIKTRKMSQESPEKSSSPIQDQSFSKSRRSQRLTSQSESPDKNSLESPIKPKRSSRLRDRTQSQEEFKEENKFNKQSKTPQKKPKHKQEPAEILETPKSVRKSSKSGRNSGTSRSLRVVSETPKAKPGSETPNNRKKRTPKNSLIQMKPINKLGTPTSDCSSFAETPRSKRMANRSLRFGSKNQQGTTGTLDSIAKEVTSEETLVSSSLKRGKILRTISIDSNSDTETRKSLKRNTPNSDDEQDVMNILNKWQSSDEMQPMKKPKTIEVTEVISLVDQPSPKLSVQEPLEQSNTYTIEKKVPAPHISEDLFETNESIIPNSIIPKAMKSKLIEDCSPDLNSSNKENQPRISPERQQPSSVKPKYFTPEKKSDFFDSESMMFTERSMKEIPEHLLNITQDHANFKRVEKEILGFDLSVIQAKIPSEEDDEEEVIQSSLQPEESLAQKKIVDAPNEVRKPIPEEDLDDDMDTETVEGTPSTRNRRSAFYFPSPSSMMGSQPLSGSGKDLIGAVTPLRNRKSYPLNHSTPAVSSTHKNKITPKKRLLNIASTQLDFMQSQLQQFVDKFGGKLNPKFDPEAVTHVVVKTDDKNAGPKTFKYVQGIGFKKWVVGSQWVEDSLKAGKLLDEGRYEALDSETLEPGARRSRERKKGLFEGFGFICLGKFPFKLNDFQQLLEFNGAIVVSTADELRCLDSLYRVALIGEDHQENATLKKCKAVPISYEWIVDCVSRYDIKSAIDELIDIEVEEAMARGFPPEYLQEIQEGSDYSEDE